MSRTSLAAGPGGEGHAPRRPPQPSAEPRSRGPPPQTSPHPTPPAPPVSQPPAGHTAIIPPTENRRHGHFEIHDSSSFDRGCTGLAPPAIPLDFLRVTYINYI